MRKLCCAVLLLFLLPRTAWADSLVLISPVAGEVLRPYEEVGRYEAGHRGVDLAAAPGSSVVAAAPGVVRFAGRVAGVSTVSIDHGNGWRTTYQPVSPSVKQSDRVSAGDQIGTLGAGHCAQGCLHWGLTDGQRYADPMAFVATPQIRLLPKGATPSRPPHIPPAGLSQAGRAPVVAPVTSPFGPRVHPITGVPKMHDGTDFGAPCGTGIHTPFDGVVLRTGYVGGYGYRVDIDHGDGLITAYAHLPGIEIAEGTSVSAGQQIGAVGTTGMSTGCHLHWMAWRNGSLIDPMTLVE